MQFMPYYFILAAQGISTSIPQMAAIFLQLEAVQLHQSHLGVQETKATILIQ